METRRLKDTWETLEGEHLKTAAEFALHALAKTSLGYKGIGLLRGGERIRDERLQSRVAGMRFENPVMVGAGWDKKGWAVDGLYSLGFAGTEVGTVLVHPQRGNDQPRLWTDETHSVGLNRLGFNSKGVGVVEANLKAQNLFGITGISLGKNKLTPDEQAPWAHAAVAERLHKYADYFVINVASPNTPGLRNLLNPKPLREIIKAVQEVISRLGYRPLFIKTTVDLSIEDMADVLQVCIDEQVDGVVDSNTTIEEEIKARYGWQGQMGGVSGNDPQFRWKANERMKFITRETKGTNLQRIGVGGITDAGFVLERIEAGAQVVQIVTGIRHHGFSVARQINQGILERLGKQGVESIEDIIGVAA